MKLFSLSQRKKRAKRKHIIEFDPRRYWVVLLCAFVLGIAVELVFFSLMFLGTSDRIEAPANPTLDTNEVKIKRIDATLTTIEKAIEARTGKNPSEPESAPTVSSQQ